MDGTQAFCSLPFFISVEIRGARPQKPNADRQRDERRKEPLANERKREGCHAQGKAPVGKPFIAAQGQWLCPQHLLQLTVAGLTQQRINMRLHKLLVPIINQR